MDLTVDLKVILAIIGLAVTLAGLFYFQWWRNRKKFSFEEVSNTALLKSDKQIREKVEILYQGTRVEEVRLIILKLKNDGYIPIKSDDFQKPIEVVFHENANILSAETVTRFPSNLDTTISHKDNRILIEPTLFNRNDFVKLQALVSTYDSNFHIDARILGVDTVGKYVRQGALTDFAFSILSTIAGIGMIFSLGRPDANAGMVLTAGVMGAVFTLISSVGFAAMFRRLRD
jgi:hypothetical protein